MKKLMSLILVGLFVMVFSTNVLGQGFGGDGYSYFRDVPDYRVKEAQRGKYDAMLEVGNAYLRRHDFVEARRWFKEAADKTTGDNNTNALLWIGKSYSEEMITLRADQKEERLELLMVAKKIFEEALYKGNKDANHHLGLVHYWYGDTNKAGEYWIKSIRDNDCKVSIEWLRRIKNPNREVIAYLLILDGGRPLK